MKALIIITIMASIAMRCSSQKVNESEVPSLAKKSFMDAYPNTKAEKWEKEDGHFEVEFDFKGDEYSLLINAEGIILETEVEVDVAKLPKSATDYVASNYAGQKIKECASIKDSKGIVTYEVELKDKDVMFDGKGNFLKEVRK